MTPGEIDLVPPSASATGKFSSRSLALNTGCCLPGTDCLTVSDTWLNRSNPMVPSLAAVAAPLRPESIAVVNTLFRSRLSTRDVSVARDDASTTRPVPRASFRRDFSSNPSSFPSCPSSPRPDLSVAVPAAWHASTTRMTRGALMAAIAADSSASPSDVPATSVSLQS
ncbi:hypothetical protein X740_05090 [Mesorhizobium sp. LNHC221B00]|nr:hypothetical protein X740_05090 [Mesorhizobium sp. LNHC221B00]